MRCPSIAPPIRTRRRARVREFILETEPKPCLPKQTRRTNNTVEMWKRNRTQITQIHTNHSCDKDNRDNSDNFWEALQVPHSAGTFVPAYSCPSCYSCLLLSHYEPFVLFVRFVVVIMPEGHSYLNSFLGFNTRYQTSVKRNII